MKGTVLRYDQKVICSDDHGQKKLEQGIKMQQKWVGQKKFDI